MLHHFFVLQKTRHCEERSNLYTVQRDCKSQQEHESIFPAMTHVFDHLF